MEQKISILMTHGITKDKNAFLHESDGDWYYEQQELGFNYRLTDIQAALGSSQLKRLDYFVEKRREVARHYLSKVKNFKLPYQHPDTNSSWHLFVVQTENRQAVYQRLKEKKIMTQVHYIPIGNQPFYNREGLEHSNHLYEHCLSIPIYVDLTREDQLKVINSL